MNPISAVTQTDPYPFYASLVQHRPMYFDEHLGFWIASSAEAVCGVLLSDLCSVRPVNQRVPSALIGTAMGQIYPQLVRFADRPQHCPAKAEVTSALDNLESARVSERAGFWAQKLVAESQPDCGHLDALRFKLPVYVVADLLGISPDPLPWMALWTRDFVRGLALGASPEALELGNAAAVSLVASCRETLRLGAPGLLTELARAAQHGDEIRVLGHGIGFLMQSFEATAGLIGNALLALGRHPDVLQSVFLEPRSLPDLIEEVNRYDPAVQNTWRFVAKDGIVAGQRVKSGDTILVMLAAANRDPAANPDPARFNLARANRKSFSFGGGLHACPGQALALLTAQAAVEHWLVTDGDLERIVSKVNYQPSVNLRMALFG